MSNESLINVFDRLPYKAKELIISKESLDLIDEIEGMIPYLESPIEEILYIALIKEMHKIEYYWYIDAQTEIECKNKKIYRLDFTLEYDEMLNRDLKENFKLNIECDGHEFHKKNKQQIKKDNQRDYDLKMEGYDILRFSGSEIYEDAGECARKILNYIIEKNELK